MSKAIAGSPTWEALFLTAVRERNVKRFRLKYAVNSQTECWEWNERVNEHGYGIFSLCDKRSRQFLAHRVSYLIANGEFSPDLTVLHRCDNPCCVNPSHLFLGTQADNVHDAVSKGRNISPKPSRGENHYAHKLTDAQINDIRQRYVPRKVTLKTLGTEFGICQAHVSMIVSGKRRAPLANGEWDAREF